MARITVEDCLTKQNNRFALVQLAAKRAKMILHGAHPVIGDTKGNKAVVTSLREIADGKVRFMTSEEITLAEAQAKAEREALLAAALEDRTPAPSYPAGDDLFKSEVPSNGSHSDDSRNGDSRSDDGNSGKNDDNSDKEDDL